MLLRRAILSDVGPFPSLDLSFSDDGGKVVVVVGAGGTGKTSIAQAISCTRPGYASVISRARGLGDKPPSAVTEWTLGVDDAARPHPLVIASPNSSYEVDETVALSRRREQQVFDRLAERGGFCFVAFSAARWFQRGPVVLTQPERTFLRHDARASFTFDDATRAELTRETKQMLSYSEIAQALGDDAIALTLRPAVDTMLEPFDLRFCGVCPRSLEPLFGATGGPDVPFDELPAAVKHLLALPTLAVRALRAAYSNVDLQTCEAVCVVDEVALGIPEALHKEIPTMLHRALPQAQWILFTESLRVSSTLDSSAIVALRRLSPHSPVLVHEGDQARLH